MAETSQDPSSSPRAGNTPSTKPKGWQPPTTEELQQLLPQYEITALLGRGGMGAVYKGRQKNLDRLVAIKILPPGMDDEDSDAQFAERFKNEARAMARLSHVGIVAVYDSGETPDGLLYIVMEFIEGTDVQKMVSQQGRLHSVQAMAITAHVCDALQYAHERGIIHRDIKPANIMVGYDGAVKVADFGLAKMTHSQNTGLTQSGMAMGTLHYMAPEALMLGSSVDHRADIYAVGVMLYFMLTGKLPQGMFELPSLQVPGLDPRYDGIIARALRDDRDIRYQLAADLRHDLDGILTQPVVKVEAGAESAQPALPTEIRPQRAGGAKAAQMPKPRVEVRVEKRSSPLLWAAIIVMGGFVLWTNLKKTLPAAAEQNSVEAAPTTPPDKATYPVATPPNGNGSQKPVTPPPINLPLPAPGVWQKLLVEDLRQTLDVQNNRYSDLVREPGGDPQTPRYRAQSPLLVFAKPPLKNCAVRARFGPGWSSNPPYLMIRYQGPGRFISNNIFDNSASLRRVFQTTSGQTNYANFARKEFNSTVIPLQQTYEMELRAVGDRFTTSKDGEVMLEGNDSAYTDGKVGFYVEKGALIESFEYMIISDSAASPAATSVPANTVAISPDGWRSLLDEKPEIRTKMLITDTGSGRHLMQRGFMPVITAPYGAIRLRAKGSIILVAKYSETSTGGQYGYRTHVGQENGQGRLFSGWITGMQTIDGTRRPSGYTPGGNQPVLPMAGGQEYELELRAYGSHLTVLVNGKIENDLINTALPGQTFAIESAGPNEFETLEWRPLDAAGNPLSAAPVIASPLASEEGKKLEQQYRDALKRQVTPAVDAYALSIQPSYAAALERALNAPGTPPAIVAALKGEIQRLTTSKTVPDADEPGTPDTLTRLRDTYRKAISAYRTEKSAPLQAIYEKQLEALKGPTAASTSTSSTSKASAQPPDQTFTNSLGMKFVPVKGTDVFFCVHETRRQDFETFCREAGYSSADWRSQQRDGIPAGQEADHPVVGVNWNDAQAFCAWLTQKTGVTHRLPTDQEWSFAVGIGEDEAKISNVTPARLSEMSTNTFPWNGPFPPSQTVGNLAGTECAALRSQAAIPGYNDGFVTTSPVMHFEPNQFGLYDLEGNVFEWCEDWADETQKTKVLRGACWASFVTQYIRSGTRNKVQPTSRGPAFGFRVVVETSASSVPQATAPPLQNAPAQQSFTNSLGMKFVSVPITRSTSPSLMFSIWETRGKDYDAFVKETKTPWERPPTVTNGLEPAVRVSWNDAQAFCQWLTDRERRSKVIGNSVIYRLPTDHEWSCAVGVGELENPAQLPIDKKGLNPTVFPWGTNWPPPPGAGNYQGKESVTNSTANPELLASTSYDDGFRIFAPAGSFTPNHFRLYDMGGNAWEWCDDWYDASQQTKVGRGSSFDVGARTFLTSSYRIPSPPDQVRAASGFRVVMAPANVAVKTTSAPPSGTSKPTPPAAGQPFTNTLGMKFVPVPGTKVLVCIHETRRGDYAQFATAMPGRDETWVKLEHLGVPVGDKDDHPAAGISWDDARAFCAWLSTKEKRIYRLPTDHEWSCAVGIGAEEAKTPNATPEQLSQQIKNEYPWGKSFPPPDQRGNLADRECGRTFSKQTVIGNYNDGFATTAPVMSFKPNAFGIYDLEGNLSEWCSDWHNEKMQYRVFRGGHWLAAASNMLLSSARMQNSGNVHGPIFGFRVVLEAAP